MFKLIRSCHTYCDFVSDCSWDLPVTVSHEWLTLYITCLQNAMRICPFHRLFLLLGYATHCLHYQCVGHINLEKSHALSHTFCCSLENLSILWYCGNNWHQNWYICLMSVYVFTVESGPLNDIGPSFIAKLVEFHAVMFQVGMLLICILP